MIFSENSTIALFQLIFLLPEIIALLVVMRIHKNMNDKLILKHPPEAQNSPVMKKKLGWRKLLKLERKKAEMANLPRDKNGKILAC